MTVTFQCDITVEGVAYKKGDSVPADRIPAGSLQALVWQQRVTTADVQTPLRTSAPEPKKAK